MPREIKLLTTKQVAEMLHLHTITVSQYAKRGIIHASKIGKGWLFSESAVNDFIKSKEAK